MSMESCTARSDQSCIDFFGTAATANTCCATMILNIIDLVSTGDADTDAQMEQSISEGLSSSGMPSEVGGQMWGCLMDHVEEIAILDSSLEAMEAMGVSMSVYCDSAMKAVAGVAALSASLFAASF